MEVVGFRNGGEGNVDEFWLASRVSIFGTLSPQFLDLHPQIVALCNFQLSAIELSALNSQHSNSQ